MSEGQTALPDRLARDIAEDIADVGEYGSVTLHISNGRVSRREIVRSQIVVDERMQLPLREVRE